MNTEIVACHLMCTIVIELMVWTNNPLILAPGIICGLILVMD